MTKQKIHDVFKMNITKTIYHEDFQKITYVIINRIIRYGL